MLYGLYSKNIFWYEGYITFFISSKNGLKSAYLGLQFIRTKTIGREDMTGNAIKKNTY